MAHLAGREVALHKALRLVLAQADKALRVVWEQFPHIMAAGVAVRLPLG
jgi:hypothetical protein